MSQSPDAFLSVVTSMPTMAPPVSALETRRARRARIEALEASLRRDFALFHGEQAPAPVPMSNPGAVAGMMRVDRSGVVFSDELDAVSHEPERA